MRLILLCLFFGALAASFSDSARCDDPVRWNVMTYNIRYLNDSDGEDVWANRRQAVIDVIGKQDIVGLQECLARQLDDIRQQTSEFDWYGVGRDDGLVVGEMTPIGYRKDKFRIARKDTFWLSETPDQKGSRGWDAALPRIVSWVEFEAIGSGEKFLFVNTHFDHRGREARANSGRLIRRWVAENATNIPAVLVGDFNAQLSDEPMKALLSEPTDSSVEAKLLRDAREVSAKPDSGPNSTWNGFREIASERRIDHILVTPKVRVLNYQTLNPKTAADRFASDHLPIRVEVSL